MDTHRLLTYAFDKENKLVHIDSVPNGKDCNCFCPSCKAPLVAKNGGVKKEHHFAHQANSDCLKGYQTALHLLAKDILLKEKKIPIINEKFQIEIVKVDEIELEKHLDDIIPDVYAIANGKPIAVEIFVTHAVDDDKYDKIQSHELTTIEINLSCVEFLEYEYVKKELYNVENMHIVYDKEFFNGILEHKKLIIRQKGVHKKIENGIVSACPMTCFVIGRFIKPKRIKSKLCDLCLLNYNPDNSSDFYCMGHITGELPDWFVRADISNNKFLSVNEAKNKVETFKSNISLYTL